MILRVFASLQRGYDRERGISGGVALRNGPACGPRFLFVTSAVLRALHAAPGVGVGGGVGVRRCTLWWACESPLVSGSRRCVDGFSMARWSLVSRCVLSRRGREVWAILYAIDGK